MQVACIEELCANESPIKQIRRAGSLPRFDISLVALLSNAPLMAKKNGQRRTYSDKTIIARLEQLPRVFTTDDVRQILGMKHDHPQRFAAEACRLGKVEVIRNNSRRGPRLYRKKSV